MHETKIRAWDKKNQKMIYDLICFYPPNSKSNSNNDWGISHSNKFNDNENGYMWNMRDLIPMHYIGRKDQNNKEIYEGDINEQDGDFSYVYYSEEACSYVLKFLPIEKGDDYCEFCLEWNKLNIVGNIFEHSEFGEKKELKIEPNEVIKFL